MSLSNALFLPFVYLCTLWLILKQKNYNLHDIPPAKNLKIRITIADYLTSSGFLNNIDVSIILGSGLGNFVHALEGATSVPYSTIPGFPQTSVAGHAGTLHTGKIGTKKVLAFAGRFHQYEGHSLEKTILPVRLSKALGAQMVIVTNAAGGVNYRYKVGDLMLIDDLIRMGSN
ncbi:MAG: purine-nucleoside phosphorylase, partial [Balneolales bacterium]